MYSDAGNTVRGQPLASASTCDVKSDLIRRMFTLHHELATAILFGISDSTYDRLERMLTETDEKLVEWYETHDCSTCDAW